jgi:hypothetical protein
LLENRRGRCLLNLWLTRGIVLIRTRSQAAVEPRCLPTRRLLAPWARSTPRWPADLIPWTTRRRRLCFRVPSHKIRGSPLKDPTERNAREPNYLNGDSSYTINFSVPPNLSTTSVPCFTRNHSFLACAAAGQQRTFASHGGSAFQDGVGGSSSDSQD